MAQRIPPPPPIAGQQQFNRWLLELTSIFNDQGTIDPDQIAELPATIVQVGDNTTSITTLFAQLAITNAHVATNTAAIAANAAAIAALAVRVTALEARNQVRNGVAAPGAGTGSVGDWYADTVAKHIYVKTAPAVWTLIV